MVVAHRQVASMHRRQSVTTDPSLDVSRALYIRFPRGRRACIIRGLVYWPAHWHVAVVLQYKPLSRMSESTLISAPPLPATRSTHVVQQEIVGLVKDLRT